MIHLEIDGRRIGPREPTLVVAELSANHHQSLDEAIELVRVAGRCGADAVKLQTYTADTLTIDCHNEYFQIGAGSPWESRYLYDLYEEAHTPWRWHSILQEVAQDEGLVFFSTPFDESAVDFLEGLDVPAYKIASFEIVDLKLIENVASTGKPIIMSTGMASLQEIEDAVEMARHSGATQIALLKCTSAYPAPPKNANLKAMTYLENHFDVPAGISDHTLGTAVPVAAAALGASIIEKHFTLSRTVPGPDSAFSLEPDEFKRMVDDVRVAVVAVGGSRLGPTEKEHTSEVFRRSLFVVNDVSEGAEFTAENVRAIRPGHGLPPKMLDKVLGRRARKKVLRGTPLSWDIVE